MKRRKTAPANWNANLFQKNINKFRITNLNNITRNNDMGQKSSPKFVYNNLQYFQKQDNQINIMDGL